MNNKNQCPYLIISQSKSLLNSGNEEPFEMWSNMVLGSVATLEMADAIVKTRYEENKFFVNSANTVLYEVFVIDFAGTFISWWKYDLKEMVPSSYISSGFEAKGE